MSNRITRKAKAKLLGLKELRVHMGLFDYEVQFIVGDYGKAVEFCSWMLDQPEIKDAETMEELDKGFVPRGRCFYKNGYMPIIWVPRKPRNDRERGTLAHECLHAVWWIFDWAGLPAVRETEEVMCHAMAHLITEFGDLK